MLKINIHNETSRLKSVILGLSQDFGGVPDLDQCYDPKSREHVLKGTFPDQTMVNDQINQFLNILNIYDVNVLRPTNIKGLNQIFSRDVCFVIKDKLFIPNIIKERRDEINAIDKIFSFIDQNNIVNMPSDTRIEGGDVILFGDYIFIGYSQESDFKKYSVARTNLKGVSFIKDYFPNMKVISFELTKSDLDPKKNSLHLDCCFQPIGANMAIMYKQGFKNSKDVDFLINLFKKENIIFISEEEMYHMNANLFSIDNNVIVSDKSFVRLNRELKSRGFIVKEISYQEIGKMGGLFRCSTMPLFRE